jgi:peptidoglycan/LPS O-acetylase OafA/YrhL
LNKSLPVTGNTTHTEPENRVVYPALDGLRAIAFLMVFMQHYLFLPWGWTGVNIFFVLSGFLITGILLDTRDTPFRVRNFYIRRTLRIFPLYYGIFIVLLLSTPFMHWHWSALWLAWPLYLGNFLRFLSPASGVAGSTLQRIADAQPFNGHGSTLYLGHLWSLCVEEQFYLIWPWIIFSIRSRRALKWICISVIVIAPIARVLAAHLAPAWMIGRELTYRFTPFQLDSLLLGALLAILWRTVDRERLVHAGQWLLIPLLACAVFYLATTVHSRNFHAYVYPSWALTLGLSFINFFAASLILCCLRTSNWVARALQWSPLRWLGHISYGAYIFHDAIHPRIAHITAHIPSTWVHTHFELAMASLALPVTIIMAMLSFYFFEKPFLNLKEKLTRRAA